MLKNRSHSKQTGVMPTVGVFDSGIGGLSVVRELLPIFKSLNLIYLMDNQFLPYGEKSDEWIQNRCQLLVKALESQFKLDILLVACNTASTIALPQIRQALAIPVVGVVPAVKVAASLSQSSSIGLLATKATVARPYVDQLIQDFAAECLVTRFPSQNMVQWAEDVFVGRAFDEGALRAELEAFFEQSKLRNSEQRMDTVVLGCTHFSFLRPFLEKHAPWPVHWIDSAQAVSQRLLNVLRDDLKFSLKEAGGPHLLNALATKDVWAGPTKHAFMAFGFEHYSMFIP